MSFGIGLGVQLGDTDNGTLEVAIATVRENIPDVTTTVGIPLTVNGTQWFTGANPAISAINVVGSLPSGVTQSGLVFTFDPAAAGTVSLQVTATNDEGTSGTATIGFVGEAAGGDIQVTMGAVTATASNAVQSITTAMGRTVLRVASGQSVSLTEPAPAVTTEGDATVNGVAKNPRFWRANSSAVTSQPFEGRAGSYSADDLLTSFPVSLASDDTLVKAVHEAGITDPRTGLTNQWAAIYVTEAAIPALTGGEEYFVSTPLGVDDARGGVKVHKVDLDAIIADLPSLDLTARNISMPTLSSVLQMMARDDLGLTITSTTSGLTGYEALALHQPQNLGATFAANYGEDKQAIVDAAWLYVMSDAVSTADKKTMLRWMLQIGVDFMDVQQLRRDEGYAIDRADGGHTGWFTSVSALAKKYVDDTAWDDVESVITSNYLQQSRFADQELIDGLEPHNDATMPFTSYLVGVAEVSGNYLRYVNSDYVTSGATARPFWSGFRGLMAYQPATGARSEVLLETNADASTTQSNHNRSTIDAETWLQLADGSGFNTTDPVCFVSDYIILVGDAVWGVEDNLHTFNPSPNATYFALQAFAVTAIMGRLLGYTSEPWAAGDALTVAMAEQRHGWPVPWGAIDDATLGSVSTQQDAWENLQDILEVVAAKAGQSENFLTLFDNRSFTTSQGVYPTLSAGVKARSVVKAENNDNSTTDAIIDVTAASVAAQDVPPGMVGFSNVWHAVTGRPIVLTDLTKSGTSFDEMMDADDTGRDTAADLSVIAFTEQNIGPIEHVSVVWWNADAGKAKTLRADLFENVTARNSDDTPYDFVNGDLEYALVDTTDGPNGMLNSDARISWALSGHFLDSADELFSTPRINYLTASTDPVDGVSRINQAGFDTVGERKLFNAQIRQKNRGRTTIFPSLGKFGDYSGGVKDANPAQSLIHPAIKSIDGAALYGMHSGVAMAMAYGYLRPSRVLRKEVGAGGAYVDYVIHMANGGTLSTTRKVDNETVATPRPHQQLDGMGFVVYRTGDTDATARPALRSDNTDDTLYPPAYRGTVTIEDTGSENPVTGYREAVVRFTPDTAFADGERADFGTDGGYGGFILTGHTDYDAELYKDALIEVVPKLSAIGYAGIPIEPQFRPDPFVIAGPPATGFAVTDSVPNFEDPANVGAGPTGLAFEFKGTFNTGMTTNYALFMGLTGNVRARIEVRPSANTLRVSFRDSAETPVLTNHEISDTGIALDTPVTILVAPDFAADEVKTWINGVLVDTQAFTTASNGSPITNRKFFAFDGTSDVDATVDHFKFWKTADASGTPFKEITSDTDAWKVT